MLTLRHFPQKGSKEIAIRQCAVDAMENYRNHFRMVSIFNSFIDEDYIILHIVAIGPIIEESRNLSREHVEVRSRLTLDVISVINERIGSDLHYGNGLIVAVKSYESQQLKYYSLQYLNTFQLINGNTLMLYSLSDLEYGMSNLEFVPTPLLCQSCTVI